MTPVTAPNLAKEFPAIFEQEIVTILKRQQGFVDELLLVEPERKELVAISLRQTKENAEIYNRALYPKIQKMVEKYVEGTPIVKKFEEGYATFQKIAVPAMV